MKHFVSIGSDRAAGSLSFCLKTWNLFSLLLIVLFIVINTRPVWAVDDANAVGSEGSSKGSAVTFQKGEEFNWASEKLFGVQLPSWSPKLLGAQFTGIYQNMPAFHNPYEGEKSLTFDQGMGKQFTHSYGFYFGSQLARPLQAYLDLELFRGAGISNGFGLGGYVNGDLIRAGPSNLPQDLYIARLYLRYLILFPGGKTEPATAAQGQLAGIEPKEGIEIKFGKLALTDDMDLNRYANNDRTQFYNYALLYNTAWDYASDTRGYSYGFTASLVKSRWRLTFGSYQVPMTSNGFNMDRQIYRARGDNLEFSFRPTNFDTVIRLLAYHNVGRMGIFREAMDGGALRKETPDAVGDEKPGREKYGFGLNLEQPLADNGETGFFARAGWSDGRTEAWSYTDCDRHLSAGVQASGVHWRREEDRFGIAYAVQGLSGQHRSYLESGGISMLIGDGHLNYGHEKIFETYYRIQLSRYLQISPDFQSIWNPGYNRDRGPVQVYGVRFHLSY